MVSLVVSSVITGLVMGLVMWCLGLMLQVFNKLVR
jgi:hypothetical protein